MKFTIEKGLLLENLSHVVKAISNKNIIPILSGIKLQLNDEGIFLTACDSDLSIRSFIPVEKIIHVEKEGEIVVQSKLILELIRKLPGDLINFELLDGLKLKIYSNSSQYDLNCMDSNEYPELKWEDSKTPLVLKASIIKNIINQTSFAVSNQESKPILTGINFKIVDNLLECIATDSYRLAKKNIKLDESIKDDVNIVIPGKNIIELDKILIDDDKVELHIFNNKILFKYKNILFQSTLLNGKYPEATNLIPNVFKFIVNTKLSDLYDSIDRAGLLFQGNDKNYLKVNIKKDKMIINSFASEIGKVEEVVNIETNTDESLELSVNAKYVLEALKTIKDENIILLLNGDNVPFIIKSVKDESLIQLILPSIHRN